MTGRRSSRAMVTAMVTGVVIAVAGSLTACGTSTGDRQVLPAGSYAGSDAEARAVTVDVNGTSLRVDGTKTRRGTHGDYLLRHGGRISCRSAPKDELVCRIVRDQHAQTIELMKVG